SADFRQESGGYGRPADSLRPYVLDCRYQGLCGFSRLSRHERRAHCSQQDWRNEMPENLRRPLVTPTLRGVHHLALCTDDMKATIDFYVDVLGLPLVHAMKVPPGLGTGSGNRGNPPYERVRHYFFDMGNDSLLAFFEIPKGKEPAANRNAIGA